MSRTVEDVERYLAQLDRTFENDGGTFLLTGREGTPPIALRVDPPVVAVRVAIGPVPSDEAHQLRVLRRLLEYNATDLLHASYGIEDRTIVLSAGLVLDNLDANELEATLADIDLALARHVPTLHDMALH
ncbi:hypothetical protein [Chondromyces crocatus]|uniref:YbjN domain-containing protein n=1 Tax=Chondromyces crocatus TaxID=52 RepID=A0A0K1EEB9_CHOCO|nr:hypothetical protein [Chondromyces crocatus]AKT39211.1 uncharacterized protein CMC5_033600 [Chondromyces crocatus]